MESSCDSIPMKLLINLSWSEFAGGESALEHVPQKSLALLRKEHAQLIEVARFLIDHAILHDRKAR
jgi:hypothetical protein